MVKKVSEAIQYAIAGFLMSQSTLETATLVIICITYLVAGIVADNSEKD